MIGVHHRWLKKIRKRLFTIAAIFTGNHYTKVLHEVQLFELQFDVSGGSAIGKLSIVCLL
jgi:hypothetical protein